MPLRLPSKFCCDYLPFSEGPRVCIGRAFAMMQMQINLAMLLQGYQLKVVEGYQFQPTFQLNARPKYGLPLQIEARTGRQNMD